jgi:hypothetical protein
MHHPQDSAQILDRDAHPMQILFAISGWVSDAFDSVFNQPVDSANQSSAHTFTATEMQRRIHSTGSRTALCSISLE